MARPKEYVSLLELHNVIINGKRTSIRLEAPLWNALELIAEQEGQTVHELCNIVAMRYRSQAFTSAVRIFLVEHLLARQAQRNRPILMSARVDVPRDMYAEAVSH
jgi:predicted DNA-binding ribbon-helix-helix protein